MKVHLNPKLLMLGCLLMLAGCGDSTDSPGTKLDTSDVASDSEPPQEDETVEFVERYERMFAPRKPKVGDVMEGIAAYDENGERFELEQTRGKPTVIVFGCLT